MKQKPFPFLLKFVCVIIVLITSMMQSFAQISEGGIPPSFAYPSMKKQSQKPYVTPINFDVKQLILEDAENESYGHPPTLGRIIVADLNMNNAGEWTILPSGERVWRLSIQAPEAIALMLYYDEFYIPKGGQLFIYNKEKTQVLGAYTENTNLWGQSFATEFVAGDELTLEYLAPRSNNKTAVQLFNIDGQPANTEFVNDARIKISGISYGYNHLEVFTHSKQKINESGTCYVNINCSEGDAWQNQKKGVVRMLLRVGEKTGACSGTIVNNTSGDLAPYFLSANHCFTGATSESYGTVTFYFHFEYPGCSNETTTPVTTKTLVGADPMVLIPIENKSDGALLKLRGSIPAAWDVYWNGWDVTGNMPKNGAGIHHPAGDVKKISTYTAPASIMQFKGVSDTGNPEGHINVPYVATTHGYGGIEGGSSGSPLFNENGLVVATLSGGNSSCSNPSGPALYGRLWFHWDRGGTEANMQMKTYLDPTNSGVQTLKGRYVDNEVKAKYTSNKERVFASESVQFIDLSYGAATYKWAFAGGNPSTSTDRNPLVIYNTPGDFNVTLTINEGTADEKTANGTITCVQKKDPCPEPVVVGMETNTSQFPLGALKSDVFSSSIYTKADLGNNNKPITKLAWYAGKTFSPARTVKIYLKEVSENTQTAAIWNDEIAGATLVYDGPVVSTILYWNTITLTQPFAYSGTKNLKVLVYTQNATTTTTSTDCYYSVANNAHMEWTPSLGGLYTTIGTVNNNRPNITVTFDEGCPATVPVSNFSIQQYEGFESMFPPKGWNILIKGENQRIWEKGTYSAVPFGKINPSNINSAFITKDTTNKSLDTWLISKPYTIAEGGKIEFYVAYSGEYFSMAGIRFYVSTNNGQNWGAAKWSTPTINDPGLEWDWRRQEIDLSGYNGQEVLFAWQFEGTGSRLSALDGIKVYSTSGKLNIYENEIVELVDLTKGPAMHWDWTIAGANIATSKAQNLSVKYTTKGTYDISLSTGNNLGENLSPKTIPITVIGKTPETAFKIRGVNTYPECNKFIPTTNPVTTFTDKSTNSPTQWAWTFPGATPATSNKQSVAVLYPATVGNTYTASLKAGNATGIDNELVKNNCITVGSKGWVWNMLPGETTDNVLVYGFGYITGTNNFGGIGSRAFVETFDLIAPVEVSKLKVAFYLGQNAKGYVTVYVCTDNGSGGPLFATNVNVRVDVANMNPNGYTEIDLPKPMGASGKMYVIIRSLDVVSKTATDVAVKSSPIRPQGEGTMMFMNGNVDNENYLSFGSIFGYDLSLNIAAEILYSVLTPESMEIIAKSSSENKALAITSNCNWEAETSAAWINLSNATGIGNGNIAITCAENTGLSRIATIVLKGGGRLQHITVKQAGVNMAVHLEANIDPTNKRNAQLKWEQPENYTADIFDDFESHPAWTDASPGSLGWHYIDVDKNYTQNAPGNYYFPGDDIYSFIIYNRDSLYHHFEDRRGISISETRFYEGLSAHSGRQALAGMGTWALEYSMDDWFISPPLNFEKDFKFSFWAKGPLSQPYMRVMYSTTGRDPLDFSAALTNPATVTVAMGLWVFYEFTIPKTARYLAIQHWEPVDRACYALFIDDVFIGTGNRPDGSPAPSSTLAGAQASPDTTILADSSFEESYFSTRPKVKPPKTNYQFIKTKALPLDKASSRKAGLYEVGKKLQWCEEEPALYIGFNEGGYIEVGSKWTAAELAPYKGLRISQVNIAVNNGINFALKIYQGGELVYSQQLTSIRVNAYTPILTSFVIDGSKDLIVAYRVGHNAGHTPAGLDASPTKDGKGNLIYDAAENKWLTMKSLGLEGNWNISVTLGSPDGMMYRILRQDLEIGRSETLDFTDPNLPTKGSVCYTVHTLYDDGTESLPSNKACIEIVEQEESIEDPSQLKAPEGFSPNGDGTNDTFVIEGIEQFADNTLSVFDVNGKIHFSAKGYNNTWDGVASQGEFKGKKLPVGIYYYILTVNGSSEKRSAVVIKY